MKTIVKSLIYDDADNVLVLVRSNTHPSYANEEDLPGGELEDSELPVESALREIHEETGLLIEPSEAHEVVRKKVEPSTTHILFRCKIHSLKPSIELSWEHKSYEWIKLNNNYVLQSKDDYISTVNGWLISNRST